MSLGGEALSEVERLLEPLAEEAVEAVVALIRAAVSHPDGALLAARRATEALAAEAFIRS